MSLLRALRTFVVIIILGISVCTPVLIATIPTANVSSQDTLNSLEKSAQNDLALGNFFKECVVISQDTTLLYQGDTLIRCVRSVISTVFLFAILWLIITITASMLGFIGKSGASGGSGPIVQTRKKIENGLIGLVLIGAPFLLITLFTNNLGNVDNFITRIDPKLITACNAVRNQYSSGADKSTIIKTIKKDIREPFITGLKKSDAEIGVGGIKSTSYTIHSKYIVSDFCLGKIPYEEIKHEITTAYLPGIQNATQATLAAYTNQRHQLTGITVSPTQIKSAEQLKSDAEAVYTSCIDAIGNSMRVAVFCEVSSIVNEVASYTPDSTIDDTALARNRWIIFTGRLYQAAFENEKLGAAIANSIIVGIENGKKDSSSMQSSVSIANNLISADVYRSSGGDIREQHLQNTAHIGLSLSSVLNDKEVQSQVAQHVIQFVSTVIQTPASTTDTSSFVQLKSGITHITMQYLTNNCDAQIGGNCYTTRSIFKDSYSTLANSLRSYGASSEAGLLEVVGQNADTLLQKSQTGGEAFNSEYSLAGLNIAEYVVSTAISTRREGGVGTLPSIVKRSADFGRQVLTKDISCSQKAYDTTKIVQSAVYYRDQLAKTVDNELEAKYISLYNKEVDKLRTLYGSKLSAQVAQDNVKLVETLENQTNIRTLIAECGGIESKEATSYLFDVMRSALPSSTPGVVSDAVNFAQSSIQTLQGDSLYKQDAIALGVTDLAKKAIYYAKNQNGASPATVLIESSLSLFDSSIKTSLECKNVLDVKRTSTQTSKPIYDWETLYKRYVKGQSTSEDVKIFGLFDELNPCRGITTTTIVSSLGDTLQAVYRLSPNFDPNISTLGKKVTDFVSTVVQTTQNTASPYPQSITLQVLDIGAYALKNFGNLPEEVKSVVGTLGDTMIHLVSHSLTLQKSCDATQDPTAAACKGLTEYDYTRSIMGVIKNIIQVQTPESKFFTDVVTIAEGWLQSRQDGTFTAQQADLGLLEIANSAAQTIVATLANNPQLSEQDKKLLTIGQNLAGKGFSITKNQIMKRGDCENAIVAIQTSVQNNTISTSIRIAVEKALGYAFSDLQLGNKSFFFKDSDISILETVRPTQSLQACANTVQTEVANALVDVAVEYVHIPGFPMKEATDFAKYLINNAQNDQYSNYRSAQYSFRLLAGVISQNACTAKEGGSLPAGNTEACTAIAETFTTVNNVLQLYIDNKATNPNFAREALRLGKSLALTFGADSFYVNAIGETSTKIITLWEESTNGKNTIFNEKTVAAELLNFAGAVLPHALKLDPNGYGTQLITTWSNVAATALRDPANIDRNAALKATAAFIASKIWDCDNAAKACSQNVQADVAVFMGVVDSINIGPASKENYVNLCIDPVSMVDTCKPKIDSLIQEMESGIRSKNENSFRQANSYLAPASTSDKEDNEGNMRVKASEFGSGGFSFTTAQKNIFTQSVNACDSVAIPKDVKNTATVEDALKNDSSIAEVAKMDYAVPQSNPCLRNPMIQLTGTLSLNLDKLVKTVLHGVSSQYGLIGIGENRIVGVLAKVALELDYNRIAIGDYRSIGHTLTRNISYVLRSLPIESLIGSSASQVVRLVGDLPWEKIIYNPLALGGAECLPPAPAKTAYNTPVDRTKIYNDFVSEYNNTLILPQAVKTSIKANPLEQGTTVGVDTPSKGGRTPACTAAIATGILSRIDFSILFTTLGGKASAGQFVNQIIVVLERMDYNCPFGQLKEDKCDQSFGTVAKNVFSILGVVDFGLVVDQKTASFIKNFVREFPTDVFTTGFTMAQLEKFVAVGSLVAEYLGVDSTIVVQLKQTYNKVVEVLKEVGGAIKNIQNIIVWAEKAIAELDRLLQDLKTIATGTDAEPYLQKAQEIINMAKDFITSAQGLIAQIRQVTDDFDQLKEIKVQRVATADFIQSKYTYTIQFSVISIQSNTAYATIVI